MDAFWNKGYEATSMADLCNCTGLHKGSLYQAFGGKRQLFMDALTHYSDKEFYETKQVISESNTPLQNIRAVINKICDDAGGECGCMIVNSMVELAPHDPEVKNLLRSFGDMRMQVMAEMIGMAQKTGEITSNQEPLKLARQLMMTLAGGAAMVKGFISQEEVTESINELIDSWI